MIRHRGEVTGMVVACPKFSVAKTLSTQSLLFGLSWFNFVLGSTLYRSLSVAGPGARGLLPQLFASRHLSRRRGMFTR